MTLSYIRSDKDFDGVYEQLKLINSYASQKDISIDDEVIDHISQNKRLDDRGDVIKRFRSLDSGVLVIYDTWVLSSHIEDVVQMFSCLLKNNNSIHFVKSGVVIDKKSDTMMVLGLIDQLRQILQDDSKRGIGRPKGSKSSSKFDVLLDQIISLLKASKSVSEIARELQVSRSSLKDYIESRELREVADGLITFHDESQAKRLVIDNISCPAER